jgi:RNA-directed DNA polymerase
MSGHRATENVSTKLQRIAELARKDQQIRFTSLAHLLTEEYLKESFGKLNRQASKGGDGVTMSTYRSELDARVRDLHERLRTGRYKASPVRRVYIPKPNGKQRPLGIPTVEDRIVQRATADIIATIYEPYFCEFSYGFRPQRSCHDALEALRQIVNRKPVRFVVEADIKSYFDTVNHAWLLKFLAHRIADPAILRLVSKWLRAGIMEKGVVCKSEEGTPQGGPISPLLANIYLHYVLDLWFIKRFRPKMQGACELVRYADDFVVCFETLREARQFLQDLRERFGQFHLELSEEKTQIIEFGRNSGQNGQTGPTETPRTFDFLGFTHFMRCRRRRYYRVARKPSSKSRNKFLNKVKGFLGKYRDRNVWWHAFRLKRMLQGYYNYFGLRHCQKALQHVRWHVERIWICELRKRSQKHRLYWSRMHRYAWFTMLPAPLLR